MTRTCLPLLICLAVAACAKDDADYPRLLPTDQILAEPRLPAHAQAAVSEEAPVETAVTDQAEALRRRAEALRGPVIEPDLRARMEQKIAD